MNKKILIVVSAVAVLAAVVAAGFFLLNNKEEDYRLIQVYEIEGTASVERPKTGTLDAYVNMRLQSEDTVSVADESYLQLKMDEDKYALLEPDTRIRLEANGSSSDSKTRIYLEQGAIVNRLEKELSKDSVYEVSTPNSTMAVRGTTFRVEVTYDKDGVSHTILTVYEGKVECSLVYPDGTQDTEGRVITEGMEVRIWGSDNDSDYELLDGTADYEALKLKVLEFLNISFSQNKPLSILQAELLEIIERMKNPSAEKQPEKENQGENEEKDQEKEEEKTYTVTYCYGDTVFATQTIKEGEKAEIPMLQPTAEGSWQFDFTTVITEDTVIEWAEGR